VTPIQTDGSGGNGYIITRPIYWAESFVFSSDKKQR